MPLEIRRNFGEIAGKIAGVPMRAIEIGLRWRQPGERVEQVQPLVGGPRRDRLGEQKGAGTAKYAAFGDVAVERKRQLQELLHRKFSIETAIVAPVEALIVSKKI